MTVNLTSNVSMNDQCAIYVERKNSGRKKSGDSFEYTAMRQTAAGTSSKTEDVEIALIPDHQQLVLELGELRKQIDELRLSESSSKSKKLGNPAVLGLAGFGLTTMVLQFHNLNMFESPGPYVWLGLTFGGIAQLIAGLQEYQNGNNFGYSAFSTYGCFWISLSLMLIGNQTKLFIVDSREIGFFLVAFTLYTALMCGAAAGISLALFLVFFSLFWGFVLLDISHFHDPKDPKKTHPAQIMAGWVLLACALGAWYVMAHIIYKDTYGLNLFPVGPPPTKFFSSCCRGNRRR